MFDKSVNRNLTFCDISVPVYLKRRLIHGYINRPNHLNDIIIAKRSDTQILSSPLFSSQLSHFLGSPFQREYANDEDEAEKDGCRSESKVSAAETSRSGDESAAETPASFAQVIVKAAHDGLQSGLGTAWRDGVGVGCGRRPHETIRDGV